MTHGGIGNDLAAQEGHDKVCRELVDHDRTKELADYRNRQRRAHTILPCPNAHGLSGVEATGIDEAIDREKFDAFVKKVTATIQRKKG